jgi:5-methylcytosine-specific restriction endonuclease McrA
MDHVKPIDQGGSNWPANQRPACWPCNRKKGARWPFDLAMIK